MHIETLKKLHTEIGELELVIRRIGIRESSTIDRTQCLRDAQQLIEDFITEEKKRQRVEGIPILPNFPSTDSGDGPRGLL